LKPTVPLTRCRNSSPLSPMTCKAAPAFTNQIVKGDNALEAGTPESFNVLIKEMQSLGLDVKVHKRATHDADIENLERFASGTGLRCHCSLKSTEAPNTPNASNHLMNADASLKEIFGETPGEEFDYVSICIASQTASAPGAPAK
jgi:hypothetical protein